MRLTLSAVSCAALALVLSCSTLVLNGCQSNIEEMAAKTHGSKAGDGYTYGTGPNKTRPYPQSEPVNINGVGGAKPKTETYSRGGNSDYTVLGQNYMVWTNCNSYQEVGTASWYGPGFHGNKTSNGEYYDQKGYTAAHKNLPLPSYLKVTNLENGRAVIVRVNDRGPFHGSRIIDLSEGAAKAIDMTKKGTAKVKLELIDTHNNFSNVTTEGGSGHNIGIGILNKIITNNTSSTTRKHLENLGNYATEHKNNGEVSTSTKIAAIGAGLYFADKIGDSLAESSQSSSSNARSLSASGNSSVTRTVTTTTTDSTGKVVTTNQVVDTTSYAPLPDELPANSNYTVNYAAPKAAATTTTTSTTTSAALGSGAFVQVFSSSQSDRASAVKSKLQGRTAYPVNVVPEDGLYRVRIGPIPESSVHSALDTIKQMGYRDAFIKRL